MSGEKKYTLKNWQWTALFLIGGLILIIIIFLIDKALRKPKATEMVDTSKSGGATGFNIGPPAEVKDDKFPLHIGSYGTNVGALQQALNRINEKGSGANKIETLTVDNDLGNRTYQAVLLLVGTRYWGKDGVTLDSFNYILHTANNL